MGGKPKKQISGKSKRLKGHNFERVVANKFKPLYSDSIRILEYQKGVGHDVEAGPWRIQCKSHKRYTPISKIEEVKEQGLPLLVTKGDWKRPVACMYLDDLLKILDDIGEAY